MFTSFKQTFHSLFTFHRTIRYLSTLFSRFVLWFAVGYNILSFSSCGSPEDVGWVVYFWWLYSLTQCNVYWVSAPCQACLRLPSEWGTQDVSLYYVSSLSQYRLDAATFLTRDNNPIGRSRPGDWITLMIQMSSFLIQRITDGGGSGSWQFSECSWSWSRHRSGAEAEGSPQDLSILSQGVLIHYETPVSQWHQIWRGPETIFISWITD